MSDEVSDGDWSFVAGGINGGNDVDVVCGVGIRGKGNSIDGW